MELTKTERESLSREISEMGKFEMDILIDHQVKKDPLPWDDVQITRNKNTLRLKEIVDKYGWPAISIFGKKAAYWAWYITQHSDDDISFQEKCLSLMKELPKEEIDLYSFAHLVDRIKMNHDELQVYGTQHFTSPENGRHMLPVENPETLKNRRKEMGLEESFQHHHERITGENY